MKQYSSDKPLISIHVPKCGGQSFRYILDQWFKENQYYHYYDELNKCLPKKINTDVNKNICIHGHFNKYRNFGINQYYPQVDQFITFLREPLEILVSNYFYLLTTSQETHGIQFDRNISLEDFLNEQLDNNLESYYLTHFPDDINENNYKEKIEDNFIFLGIMEEFQISIDLLAKKLNKERVIIPQRNTAKRDTYEINSELMKKIKSKYKIDYLIYNYALEKLKSNKYETILEKKRKTNMENYLLTKGNFDQFSYSKRKHFDSFAIPEEFFGLDIDDIHPKFYQDLFIYNFLLTNLSKGSKILEIGDGDSRIYKWFNGYFDITILDKFEGKGNGLQSIPKYSEGKVVRDYIGNFSKKLEDSSFDCIFSISVLEHIPHNKETIDNVIKDINRLLKKDAYSVHAIDCVMKNETFYWKHPIIDAMFSLQSEQNLPIAKDINKNDDFYYMSEKAYNKTWKVHTKKEFSEHGKAFSVNVVYQK